MSSSAPDAGAASHWRRLDELFGEACEVAPAAREAWLRALPPADLGLEDELRSLLLAHDRGGDFLAEAVEQAERSLGAVAEPVLLGKQIGSYRLVRLLGRGGMGAVYLAERADRAFRQRVAVKLIPWALATPEARHRFQAERQTLAELEHPNIARLLDGGETEDGLPYLVMEYVDGEPIDAYCESQRLDVERRLLLFREVCAAVEHAHRNLVVHRDLKPPNILVTAAGEVKLLDFGIAKLLPGNSVEATFPLTRAGGLLLTPLFASPEQVRGEAITTATDTYALGLLLYRLLAGRHPYSLATGSPGEVERVVCEQLPPRPSVAAGGAVAAPALPALRRRLRGDLDNIVLMALRKEPERRYASVGQLSEDVQRHLDLLPVRARPDTLAYRGAKFMLRHRVMLAAALLVLASLLAGLLATARQARIAERRFQEVRTLANGLLFEVHDAIAPLPGSTAARQLLVRNGLAYLDRLAAEAGGDPALELELATSYQKVGDVQGNPVQPNLGDIAGALAAYQKAQQILAQLLASSPASVAVRAEIGRCELRTAEVLGAVGRIAEAVRHHQRSVELLAALAAEAPGDGGRALELARSHIAFGDLRAWNSDLPGALADFGEARRILERLAAAPRPVPGRDPAPRQGPPPGPDPAHPDPSSPAPATTVARELATTCTKIGDALCWQDRCREAIGWHSRAIAALAALARTNPNDAATLHALLIAHLKMGEAMEGVGDAGGRLAACETTLAVAQAVAGADPRDALAERFLAISHDKLGDALAAARRFAAAQDHYQTAKDILTSLAERDPANLQHRRDLANTLNRIGEALLADQRLAAAVGSLREALALREWLVEHDPQDLFARRDPAISYANLAAVHLRLAAAPAAGAAERRGHRQEACDLYRHALRVWADLEARGGLKPADRGEVESVRQALRGCTAAPDQQLAAARR